MQYTAHYESPLGGLLLAADDVGLTGLWFDGEKYYALHLAREHECDRLLCMNRRRPGWIVFFRAGTGFYAAAAFDRHAVPAGGLGAAAADPPWKNHNIRSFGKDPCGAAGLERMSAQAVGRRGGAQ